MPELDALLLSRIQFAFTVGFHIIFPAFTIGLASFLALIEGLYLYTNNHIYQKIYKFWIKIFAIAFGIGVVSGVALSYQFGTNWSLFSDKSANILGPLLGYEVLTAFFLEASFLGIMLFGSEKVSKKMHFAATCIVAFGTILSAFWIIAANSWMQTPQGFNIGQDGRLNPVNWFLIVFNPSFPYRFFHMITATYLTTAFVVGGVSAWYLLKEKYQQEAKVMFNIASLIVIFAAPLQIFVGHEHGINTLEHQPVKIAAMEGNWEKKSNVPFYLFALPNQKEEKMEYAIKIPHASSLILTGTLSGAVPHLKSFPKEYRPPVSIVFWSFRVMVGMGGLMLLISLISILKYLKAKLFTNKTNKFLYFYWIGMIPSGFIAILAGWFVTEVGRQPWSVYGVLKTAHSVSPNILGAQVAWSLLSFIVLYSIIFATGIFYIIKLIKKGFSEV